MHELTKIEEIKQLTNLEVYHLKIDHDKDKDILIYDRKLEKGSGPSIYGLKVCDAMGMSKEFISFAKNIQNRFDNNSIHTTKKSQYNSNIFMDECKICRLKGNKLETHHIKDQQYADKNNMIDGHHKNIKHNLVPLCKDCHLRVTNGEVILTGWKKTNQGKILVWSECNVIQNTKKKFSDEDVKTILNLKEENNGISQKDFLKKLELENDIKLSISTLKKMIDKKY